MKFFDGSEPAYKQLCEKIIKAITEGELKPGDRLPSEAALYHSTGLSKGTIRMAYEELEHRGALKEAGEAEPISRNGDRKDKNAGLQGEGSQGRNTG